MPRPNKQKRHMQAMTKRSLTKTESTFRQGIRAAFFSIIAGIPFTIYYILSLVLGETPISKEFSDKGMEFMTELLLTEAQSSAEKYFSQMETGAKLSYDASWSHRRQAKYCVGDFIDIKSKKIVAFDFADKNEYDKRKNYNGASNLMESFIFKKTMPKLQNSQKVSTIIKDGDTKIENIIKESGWKVDIINDVNHKLKNFHTSFAQINKKHNNSLRGFEKPLKKWLGHILFSENSPNDKIGMWENSIQHFLGNHTLCKHEKVFRRFKKIKNENQYKAIIEIIDFWRPFILDFIRGDTTNYNEVFHSVKAKFVSKFYNFGCSTLARMAASVLQYNEGYYWIFKILSRPHMRLIPSRCLFALYHFIHGIKKKEIRKVEKYHEDNQDLDKRRKKREKENKLENNKNKLKHK